MGLSPLKVAFAKNKLCKFDMHDCSNIQDGITDSIRYMIMQEHFIKPYSEEHVLVKLLTKAFNVPQLPSNL